MSHAKFTFISLNARFMFVLFILGLISSDILAQGSTDTLNNQFDTSVLDAAMPSVDSLPAPEAPVEEVVSSAPKGVWTFQGSSTINTSQSQFSNWQGGGQNSIAL